MVGGLTLIRPRSEFGSRRAVSAAVGLRRCRPRLNTARGGEMRLDTCRASPQVVAAGGMASSGAREPVEDPASKVLITSRVADQNPNTIPASRLMQRWRWITA